jgi:hypothetical protein
MWRRQKNWPRSSPSESNDKLLLILHFDHRGLVRILLKIHHLLNRPPPVVTLELG